MNILGIHIGHDSSAALVVDGRIVADVAEERFSRVKHYCGLPVQSVDYCLKAQRRTMADIDMIAIATHDPVPEFNFLFDLKGTRRELTTAPKRLLNLARQVMNKLDNGPLFD